MTPQLIKQSFKETSISFAVCSGNHNVTGNIIGKQFFACLVEIVLFWDLSNYKDKVCI